jgi:hypothetical protein
LSARILPDTDKWYIASFNLPIDCLNLIAAAAKDELKQVNFLMGLFSQCGDFWDLVRRKFKKIVSFSIANPDLHGSA